jgi:hypothetical protein
MYTYTNFNYTQDTLTSLITFSNFKRNWDRSSGILKHGRHLFGIEKGNLYVAVKFMVCKNNEKSENKLGIPDMKLFSLSSKMLSAETYELFYY